MKTIITLLITFISYQFCQAQNLGDYRSVFGSGFSTSWQNIASWETYNGTTWIAASATPDFSDGKITIRDTIQNFGAITIDEVEIENNAFIRSYVTLTLNSGPADELIIKNGGQLLAFAEIKGTNATSNIGIDMGGTMTTNGGKIDSFVMVDIRNGGVMDWTGSGSFTNEGIINNYGTIHWINQQGLTATNKIGVVNNYNLFDISSGVYSGNINETHFFNEQILNNYGTMTIDDSSATIGFSDLGFNSIYNSHFNNYGEINVKKGRLSITQEAYLYGTINVDSGAALLVFAYKENSTFADHIFDSLTVEGKGSSSYFGNMNITAKNAWLNEDSTNLSFNQLNGPGTLYLKHRHTNYNGQTVNGNLTNQMSGNMYFNNNTSKIINGTLTNNGTLWWQRGGVNAGTGTLINNQTILAKDMTGNFTFSSVKLENNDSIICDDPSFYLDLSATSEFEQSNTGILVLKQQTHRLYSNPNSIDGKINIAAGSKLFGTGTGIHFIGDSLICNGNIEFAPFHFKGTSAQFVKGSGNIQQVVIDNLAHIYLASNFAILNQLTFTNGKFFLGAFNLSLINATTLGANNSSYLVTNGKGFVRSQVNTSASVPFFIGTMARLHKVEITNSGTGDIFSARVIPNLYRDMDTVNDMGVVGSIQTEEGVEATWFIEEDVVGGSNVDLELSFPVAARLLYFDSSNARVVHFTNDGWSEDSAIGSVYKGSGISSVTRTGISQFSPFAIWSGNPTALPIHWLGSGAEWSGTAAKISWKALNDDEQITHFTIERSLDGISFTPIAKITAASGTKSYHYLDDQAESLARNTLFYRIKTNLNEYTPTYSLTKSILNPLHVNIFPNPAANTVYVQTMEHINSIALYTLQGEKLVETSNSNLSIIDYAAGIYLLKIQLRNGSQQTTRLTIN